MSHPNISESFVLFWLNWLREIEHWPNDYAWSYIYDTECRVVPSQRHNFLAIKQWLRDHDILGEHLFEWVPLDVEEHEGDEPKQIELTVAA